MLCLVRSVQLNFLPFRFQEVASAAQKLFDERRAKEAAAVEAARLARRELRAKKVEAHFADICPGLMMPHAQKNLRKISDVLEPQGEC